MTSLNLATLTGASAGLTTATTAYTDGDQLGTVISMAMTAPGIILSANLIDKAKIVAAVDAFIFDRAVTAAADNAANSFSDADMLFLLDVIEFPAAKASALNGLSVVDSLAIPYVANASNTISVYLVTRSGHTFFGAATDLQIRFTYSKDV